jgi:hypothetical protein
MRRTQVLFGLSHSALEGFVCLRKPIRVRSWER